MESKQQIDSHVNQQVEIKPIDSSTLKNEGFPNWSESGVFALYLFLAFLAALALSRHNVFGRRRR